MASTHARVLVDVNVLLTVLFHRDSSEAAYRELKSLAGRACISVLSVHIFLHFAARHYPLRALHQFLNDFEILPLTATDVSWAFANVRDSDFEDALQLAIAVRERCGELVTFDQQFHQRYVDLPQLEVRLLQA